MTTTLDRDAVVHVPGHRGLVGGAVWRHFQAQGFTGLIGRTSAELDLRDCDAAFAFCADESPHEVAHGGQERWPLTSEC